MRRMTCLVVAVVCGLGLELRLEAQNIVTVAGGGPNNMPALSANLDTPRSVAVDTAGNLFICAARQGRIFKVNTGGQLTVVAGTGGGPGFSGDGGPATSASLSTERCGVAVDSAGNVLIADSFNNRIRRVDAATGIITTVAGGGFSGDGGPATSASLLTPLGVAVDSSGNLFIAEEGSRVRRVDAATGIITTVAGNGSFGFSGDGGPATSASLSFPFAVAVDSAGNLFIADTGNPDIAIGNNRIRRVDAATGIITTVAGNGSFGFSGDGGPATSASLGFPLGVAVDSVGNLFVADFGNSRVRRVDAATGIITTVVGNGNPTGGFSGDGGPATSASLSGPNGVAVDSAGNLFIADTGNERIRRVDASTRTISTVAGNGTLGFSGDGGPATNASLGRPEAVAVNSVRNLYSADRRSSTQRVRAVNGATGIITTVAGNGIGAFSGDGGPATDASLFGPEGVSADSSNKLYIVENQNHRIRRVDLATGIITTFAGNGIRGFSGDGGPATSASLSSPEQGVAVDSAGNVLIADTGNERIRRVDAATGIITTVAGNGSFGFSGDGGPATSASLACPEGLALDSSANLYFAERCNQRIRRVDAVTGIITTVAGNGIRGFSGDGGPATSASLAAPEGLAIDSAGNLFIGDTSNHRIRRVDAVTAIITTVAGNGIRGFSGDGGPATSASLANPEGVAVGNAGQLYIADRENHRIRRITQVITVAIDIKPGEDPPSINPKSQGKIPVAILSSSTFDATTQVDRTSLTFGHTGDEQSLAFCNPGGQDVNGDGLLDLVCHFDTQKTGFQTGDTVGVLKGKTVTGTPIKETDSIRIVP